MCQEWDTLCCEEMPISGRGKLHCWVENVNDGFKEGLFGGGFVEKLLELSFQIVDLHYITVLFLTCAVVYNNH